MSLMYAQIGLGGINALAGFAASKEDAKLRESLQRYQNSMSAFTAAQQLNTQTINEINVRDAAVTAAQSIELQSMADKANAEVAAAAAGVRGGAVQAAMRGLERSKLQAHQALKRKMDAQALANREARRGIAINKALNKDVSVIPRASPASALLGFGASVLDVLDQHRPEGSKSTDAKGLWGF